MKTVDEIIDNMIDEMPYHINISVRPYIREAMELYAKDRVEFAQRWISVEDELPKAKQDSQVLVKWNHGGYGVNEYYALEKYWKYEFDHITITHWRPIEIE